MDSQLTLKPGNLGALTTYSIEDVFNYLGETRVRQRIDELKGQPTMMTKLDEFLTGDGQYNYYSGAGVFWIFDALLGYFPEEDFAKYLYQKAKEYNESNYHNGKFLTNHYQRHLKSLNRTILKNPPDIEYWKREKNNKFWIDYHYFINTVVDIIYKSLKTCPQNEEFLLEVYENYDYKSELILDRIKDSYLWLDKGIGNMVYQKISTYYRKRQNIPKALVIKEHGRSIGWRII